MKVDLSSAKIPESSPGAAAAPEKRFSWKKFFILSGAFLLVLIVGLLYQTFVDPLGKISEGKFSLFSQIKSLSSNDPLRGEKEDRINILLLGIGGEGHPGGTLTDTIIVASVKPSTNQVSLLSLPRDLVVKYYSDENPKYWEGLKINHSYEKGGATLADEKIQEVTGLKIHYHVLVDFYGFRKIIDDLGGVDVYVENSFVDREYPDYNYGYQSLTFKKGWERMNGERALQFARSRHGNNGEGSDFSRSARQQKILEAVKKKTFSLGTLLNPLKMGALMNDLGDHIQSNMEIWEMIQMANITQNISEDTIVSRVVDAGPDGLLESEIANQTGAYVLVPKAGDYNYSAVHQLAKNIFETEIIVQEKAKIVIQNGTKKNGLAAQMGDRLTSLNLNVLALSNAPTAQNKTVIYDFSQGQNPKTLETIQKEIGGSVATLIPVEIQLEFSDAPDILIILGQDLLPAETSAPYAT